MPTPRPSPPLWPNARMSYPKRLRKEWVRWITKTKKPDTRTTRIIKTVQSHGSGCFMIVGQSGPY
jgi:hypothetical protein